MTSQDLIDTGLAIQLRNSIKLIIHKLKSLKQSFKNTLFIYLGFVFGGINTLVLYTRFLEDEYYGLVTYLLATSNILMPLIALGIHHTIVKFFSSYFTKADKDKFLSSKALIYSLVLFNKLVIFI